MFGDVEELGTAGGQLLSRQSPEQLAKIDEQRYSGPLGAINAWMSPPSGEDISRTVTTPAVGEHYDPQYGTGTFAKTAAEFAPAMLSNPKSLVTTPIEMLKRVGTRLMAPAAGAEAGSAAANAAGLEEYEPYIRFATTVLAGGAAAPAEAGRFKAAADKIKENPAALERMASLLRQSGMSEDQINSKMASFTGPVTPMDVSRPMAWQGGRIVAKGGEPGNIISDTMQTRHEGGNQRIDTSLKNIGPREDPSEVRADFNKQKQAIGAEYPAAHAAQKQPVNTQSIADELDAELGTSGESMSPTLQSIRNSLNVKGGNPADPSTMHLDPSTERLHAARKDIGNMLYDADGNIKAGLGREEAGLLKKYYGKVTDALHAASDPFKDVDTRYSDVSSQSRAYESGRNILDSGRNVPTERDVANTLTSGGPTIKNAMARGTLTDLYRIVGQNANDRAALQNVIKGDGDWNRDKLVSLFGKDKADALFKRLEEEKIFSETKNTTTGGSPTASRQADDMGPWAGLSTSDVFKVGGIKAIPRAVAMRVVDSFLEKYASGKLEARDTSLANMLSGKVNRQDLAKALQQARTAPSRASGPLISAIIAAQHGKEKR